MSTENSTPWPSGAFDWNWFMHESLQLIRKAIQGFNRKVLAIVAVEAGVLAKDVMTARQGNARANTRLIRIVYRR